jgi:hypothetical protein
MTKDSVREENTVYYETSNIIEDETKLIHFEKNNLHGLLMPDRQTVYVEPIYEYIDVFYNGLAIVKRDGKWGMINKLGKEIVEPKYDYINPYSCGFARIAKNGKVGFLDKNFKESISPKFNHAYPFKDGLALVDKSYYIDTLGKKAEKLVEGVVRSGNCHELPNYMKDVFPRYECISLYHGDICEQIEKEKEDQKKNKK